MTVLGALYRVYSACVYNTQNSNPMKAIVAAKQLPENIARALYDK